MPERKQLTARRRTVRCLSLALLMYASGVLHAADSTWDGDSLVGTQGDGRNWSDANNWTSGGIDDAAPPDAAPGDDLLFGGGSVGVVRLGTNRFVNSLVFTAGFTLDMSGSQNVLNLTTGDITVSEDQKPVTINAIVNSSSGLTITGSDTQADILLRGNNIYSGSTSVSDCMLQVQSDANLGNAANGLVLDNATLVAISSFVTARSIHCGGQASTLSVGSGSTLTVDGSLSSTGQVIVTGGGMLELNGACTLNNLNVSTGKVVFEPTTQSPLMVGGLTLNGATLDLTNSDMIIHNGIAGAVGALLTSGFNGGNWKGSGIVSSVASSKIDHLTTLGYLLNNTGSNQPIVSTFDGEPVADTDVLLKYTYLGDANLDGKVDASDYSRIDSAYILDRTNPAAATGWYNGDFNYDGLVNGSDYTLIDNAFNLQGASLATSTANPLAAVAIEIAPVTAVPEPASLILFAICGWLGKRRPNSQGG